MLPVKAKKPRALKAFLKLKPDRTLLDAMLEAIDRQKQTITWRKNNGQFIPHPSTWLNNRQWEAASRRTSARVGWDEFIAPDKEES